MSIPSSSEERGARVVHSHTAPALPPRRKSLAAAWRSVRSCLSASGRKSSGRRHSSPETAILDFRSYSASSQHSITSGTIRPEVLHASFLQGLCRMEEECEASNTWPRHCHVRRQSSPPILITPAVKGIAKEDDHVGDASTIKESIAYFGLSSDLVSLPPHVLTNVNNDSNDKFNTTTTTATGCDKTHQLTTPCSLPSLCFTTATSSSESSTHGHYSEFEDESDAEIDNDILETLEENVTKTINTGSKQSLRTKSIVPSQALALSVSSRTLLSSSSASLDIHMQHFRQAMCL